MTIPAPEWTARLDRVLAEAARSVRLLGAVTPVDAAVERARLIAAFERGAGSSPRWAYPHVDCATVRRALDAAERDLTHLRGDALAEVYLARIQELALEAELSTLAGTPSFPALARRRFGAFSPETLRSASALASEWALVAAPPPEEPPMMSDADDAASLLSRMRAEVGKRRLPFSVVTHGSLTPLAATGEDSILVAPGRPVSPEDIARTVLHEIEGHALPRVRAREQALGVFAFGTARGADEQEGRAIHLEARHGFLTARRKRQLAARHVVVDRMLADATFHDAVTALLRDNAFAPRDAVVIAERAYRGGDGVHAGLGRERVYLESYVRVRDWLATRPEDDDILSCGQVALEAIATLRAYAR